MAFRFLTSGMKTSRKLGLLSSVLFLGLMGCGSEVGQDSGDTLKGLYGIAIGKDSPATGSSLYRQLTGQSVGEVGDAGLLKCPPVEVRQGTQHKIFYTRNSERTSKDVAYQGSIRKTARECDFFPQSVSMKFGVAGRVLLGPSGSQNSVVLPMQAVFVGKDDQVVWNKTYNIPVTIDPTTRSTFFTHVEQPFEFQPPPGAQLSDFRLYVGFLNENSDID